MPHLQKASIFRWLNDSGYPQGVFWALLVCVISASNDVLMRLTGERLGGMQVAFFRFFFATLTLLPFMLYRGKEAFVTQHPILHAFRAILGFGAVACWCYGVTLVPLTTATTLSLTVPLFVLPMAYFFLKEKVGLPRTLATLAGFAGILVIVQPSTTDFNAGALVLLASATMFAMSDILNKKMVGGESPYTMLFYFAAGTTIAGAIPAYLVWQSPTLHELGLLALLGIGGNLILFCLLKAFKATEVSALAPIRYVELIISGLLGFIVFSELPHLTTLLGALIIVPSTLAITYYETHQRKKSTEGTSNLKDAA